MPQVAIQKCQDSESTPHTLLERMEAITESIRRRAFDIFQTHHRGGSQVDDWLRAERDVVWSPTTELVDHEKEFVARIALPGYDADDIQLSVMPDSLIIEGNTTHTHEIQNGSVCFCEFSDRLLFRQLDLPGTVDVNRVIASLDKGILQIRAPKAANKQLAAGA